MRVVYWARLGLAREEVVAALDAVAGAELQVVATLPELLAALPGAEALVLYDAPQAEARAITQAIDSPGAMGGITLRWMHLLSAGREGFEAAGMPRRALVTWAAGGVAPTVAEHAFALLLAFCRRIPQAAADTAAHHWDRRAAAGARALEGGVLAIVGCGHIGRALARRARAFGMTTLGCTRTPRPDALLDEVHPLAQLHCVLARADAVVVAIALTAATRHLFDRAAFAACKPGALFVNVARGGVVDQVALREALLEGRLAGAGLDVTEPEPLPSDDPLWSAPNLLVSAHYGGGGGAVSRRRLAEGAAENLRRLIAGEPLRDLVG